MPQDPDAATEEAKEGRVAFNYGTAFEKAISIGSGQCRPSQIISHELPLNQAADAYDKFDRRVDGYTRVILHPGQAA